MLGNHHAGKNGVDRGSSALRGAADTFAKIERSKDTGPRSSILTVEDMRDGEPAPPIAVTFGRRAVRQDKLGPVWRWFVESHQEAPAADTAEKLQELTEEQTRQEQVIEAIRRAGRAVTRQELMLELEWPRTTLQRVLQELLDRHRVERRGFAKTVSYQLTVDTFSDLLE